MRRPAYLSTGLTVVLLACSVVGADGPALKAVLDSIETAAPDSASVADASGLTLEHVDFSMKIDSGCAVFFRPIVIDSGSHLFALYIRGCGSFQFAPSVPVEQGQLSRFFKSDSLDRRFCSAIILGDDSLMRRVRLQVKPGGEMSGKELKRARDEYVNIFKKTGRGQLFATLRAIQGPPAGLPYLFAYAVLSQDDQVAYEYYPYQREQITLSKRFTWGPFTFLEPVCSYAQEAIQNPFALNGQKRDLVAVNHYDIDAAINSQGTYSGGVKLSMKALDISQVLDFSLDYQLAVDSVTDGTGHSIPFQRYRDDKDYFTPLYLFFDRPFLPADTLSLTVFSHGDIADRTAGHFFVTASSDWYPTHGFRGNADFDLTFKTPKITRFVATGELKSTDTVKDTVITHWKVAEPTGNVSFAIGIMDRFPFSDTLAGAVDVYYSEDLHQELAQAYNSISAFSGKHMEKQVAEDVINSLRLFSYRFGRYPYGRMAITEILALHGEAFPAFTHLGLLTWGSTDAWGYERIFRAHEIAHQWWGVGVGYETYHDQWLSEGMSEYSALMYLQTVAGNDQFMDRLKEYRKAVVSVREKPTDSSSETGPIILGYRTSSTKSDGNADLVIYKKGALVIHMLRNMLIDWRTFNEDKFFNLMKEFYQTYRGRTASTADFQHLVEKYTGEDMTWFFNQWVYGTEIPTYRFTYDFVKTDDGTYSANCKVITSGVNPNFAMTVPLEIQIDDQRKAIIPINLSGSSSEFTLPKLSGKPKGLKLNPFESVLADVKQ